MYRVGFDSFDSSELVGDAVKFPHDFFVFEVSAGPSRCCFKWLFHWTGPGWFEIPTEWNLYKRVRARGDGAWACFTHALQCLQDGRACCPSLPKQLVICRFLRCSPAPSRCCYKSVV